MDPIDFSPRIRKSQRAKRLRLMVKPGGIELVVPERMSESRALAFYERHRLWAEGKLAEAAARRAPVESFVSGLRIPWQGRELPLQICEEPRVRPKVSARDTGLMISIPRGLGTESEDVAKRALFLWVRRQMLESVTEIIRLHGARFGLVPRELRVKKMKTRWGSCGPKNDINLNWLLGFAPECVLEYVVVHELCHIRERNHSQAFWSLVAAHLPDYAERRAWLSANGAVLLQRF